jgi:hypothetical protein
MSDTPQLPSINAQARELGNAVRAQVFAAHDLIVKAIEREWSRAGAVSADRLADIALGVVWPVMAEREAHIKNLEQGRRS